MHVISAEADDHYWTEATSTIQSALLENYINLTDDCS
jgi:hypothetical protein